MTFEQFLAIMRQQINKAYEEYLPALPNYNGDILAFARAVANNATTAAIVQNLVPHMLFVNRTNAIINGYTYAIVQYSLELAGR
jgi:hypothetical protein